MPIEVQCQHCKRKIAAPERFAGKRAKCPNCKAAIEIPAAPGAADAADDGEAADAAVQAAAAKHPEFFEPAASHPPAQWYLQTEDGEQYGPVGKDELDSWMAEGRVDSTCQVLCEGWEQWKWAEDVYPALAATTEQAVAVPLVEDDGALVAAAAAEQESQETAPAAPPAEASSDAAEASDGVTPDTRRALAETRPWVLILSIVGLIFGGLGAASGLVMIPIALVSLRVVGVLIGLMMLVGPALCLVASYFLFTYATKLQQFLRHQRPRDLEAAMIAQKSCWKLTGIIVLAALGFYIVMSILLAML